jgi:branched-chain amino acid transport system permease protein
LKFWLVRLGSIAAAFAFCFVVQGIAAGRTSFDQRLFLLAGLYVTLAVSLNLINGITGQFSIGHAAFYQVGAYTAGFLAGKFYKVANLPPIMWLISMVLVGALIAGIAGLIVGLPSLRLKGDYLAIVTLGFGEIIRIVAQNQQELGGSYGMSVQPRLQFIWLAWMLAILAIAVSRNLLKSAHGLPFLAVRDDEVASAAMGVNVTRTKVTAFVIGSMFAGGAGAILAHFEGFVSPQMFPMDLSFIVVTMVVLGGTGSITGSVIAAIFLFYLPEKMRELTDLQLGSVAALIVVLFLGVAGMRHRLQTFHGPAPQRYARYSGLVAICVALWFALSKVLQNIPALAVNIEGAKLRLVVFAVVLIMLMLLRPQGILGGSEFSWNWVNRLLNRKTSEAKA